MPWSQFRQVIANMGFITPFEMYDYVHFVGGELS